MSATICPTITVETETDFDLQLEVAASVSERVHIDLSDGLFTPHKLLSAEFIALPSDVLFDIHCMVRYPTELIRYIDAWLPHTVILHAEADHASVLSVIDHCENSGIRTGLALLPESSPKKYQDLLVQVHHCLIFGGKLGFQGGEADLSLLAKIDEILAINPLLEIAWDGGINEGNILELKEAGVEVFNVGSGIQKAENPKTAYESLNALLQS